MAKKFLDQTGLTTLWNKIKSVFATKSESNQVQTNLTNFMNTKAKANGLCPLGSDTKVPSTYLPSYVDDVVEYGSITTFPVTGEDGKIYVAEDTNKTYRWSGSGYVEISPSLALGETSSTAYAGNKGKANADAIAEIKSQIGGASSSGTIISRLKNVENNKLDKQGSVYSIVEESNRFSISYGGTTKIQLSDNGFEFYVDGHQLSLIKAGFAIDSKAIATISDLNNKVDKESTINNGILKFAKPYGSDEIDAVRYDNANYACGVRISQNGEIGFWRAPEDGYTAADDDYDVTIKGDGIYRTSNNDDETYKILDESMALTTSEIEAICV